MSIMVLLFIGISIAIVFLFIYIFLRDKEIDRKFHFISAALDNINEEIYILQKHQKDNSLNDIKGLIAEQLEDVLNELILTIKQTQAQNRKDIEVLFEKVENLQSNIKGLTFSNINTTSGVSKKDDIEKIRELYDIGYSIEEISKEIGMSAGEVKLFLNLL